MSAGFSLDRGHRLTLISISMFDTHSLMAAEEKVIPKQLTPGEKGVYAALVRAVEVFGNPTVAEIASCATATVYSAPPAPMIHKYLRRLEAKGYVELRPRRARSIKLLGGPNEGMNG